MKTVDILASTPYPVFLGRDSLSKLTDCVTGSTCCIVSDSHVWSIYGKQASDVLKNAGFHVVSFVFSPGENSKNTDTFVEILNFLAENGLTRQDCIVALGGGVTGDLAGFAAACYMRGIAYVQVPTSLLAMVDSSVGGKTGIDLPAGKNLAGAFWQPRAVLCDTRFLDTLPEDAFLCGCAEVIKYGILYDEALFSHLEATGLQFDREYVIERCIRLKAQAVSQDERDQGARQFLNLGHTVGHAIETESNFALSHGQAVAIGMAAAARASLSIGLCREETRRRIEDLLVAFGLPVSADLSCDALLGRVLHDKKCSPSGIRVIVPYAIGSCGVLQLDKQHLSDFIQAGLCL